MIQEETDIAFIDWRFCLFDTAAWTWSASVALLNQTTRCCCRHLLLLPIIDQDHVIFTKWSQRNSAHWRTIDMARNDRNFFHHHISPPKQFLWISLRGSRGDMTLWMLSFRSRTPMWANAPDFYHMSNHFFISKIRREVCMTGTHCAF